MKTLHIGLHSTWRGKSSNFIANTASSGSPGSGANWNSYNALNDAGTTNPLAAITSVDNAAGLGTAASS